MIKERYSIVTMCPALCFQIPITFLLKCVPKLSSTQDPISVIATTTRKYRPSYFFVKSSAGCVFRVAFFEVECKYWDIHSTSSHFQETKCDSFTFDAQKFYVAVMLYINCDIFF